jgi:hypothetical protein
MGERGSLNRTWTHISAIFLNLQRHDYQTYPGRKVMKKMKQTDCESPSLGQVSRKLNN